MVNKNSLKPSEADTEVVEWIDGERITLQEYESRLSDQVSSNAGNHLLHMTREYNWTFGLPG